MYVNIINTHLFDVEAKNFDVDSWFCFLMVSCFEEIKELLAEAMMVHNRKDRRRSTQ